MNDDKLSAAKATFELPENLRADIKPPYSEEELRVLQIMADKKRCVEETITLDKGQRVAEATKGFFVNRKLDAKKIFDEVLDFAMLAGAITPTRLHEPAHPIDPVTGIDANGEMWFKKHPLPPGSDAWITREKLLEQMEEREQRQRAEGRRLAFRIENKIAGPLYTEIWNAETQQWEREPDADMPLIVDAK